MRQCRNCDLWCRIEGIERQYGVCGKPRKLANKKGRKYIVKDGALITRFDFSCKAWRDIEEEPALTDDDIAEMMKEEPAAENDLEKEMEDLNREEI